MEISNESKLFFKETIIYHIFECLWISDLFSPIITTIISLFIYDYLRSKKIKNKLEFIRATLLDPYLTSDQIIFCCPPIIFFENQSDMPIFYEILKSTKIHSTRELHREESNFSQNGSITNKILSHQKMFVSFPTIKIPSSEGSDEIIFNIHIKYGKKENKLYYDLKHEVKLLLSLERTSNGLRHTVCELNI